MRNCRGCIKRWLKPDSLAPILVILAGGFILAPPEEGSALSSVR